MTTAKLKHSLWFILIFVLLTTNCGVINTETSITVGPSGSLTTSPPSPVSTSTMVTPTMTHTSVPATSMIAVPTLSQEEKQQVIDQLLTEDYHCMLPCWGGIEPGATTRSTALAILEQVADEVYLYNDSAKINYLGKSVYVSFYARNNVVESISAPRFEYPLYRLLQDYGKPDEVYFYILDILPIDTNNPYTVYLFYREKGIIAEYNGVSAKGAAISVCFLDSQGQKSQTALLSLWSKGSDKTFEDVIAQYMSKFSPGYLSLRYHSLEELSSYTSQEFHEIYEPKENENYCLEIKNPNPGPS
ncbi:MAG: hypothetical protein MN733_04685 [Nitrososphaera sp.]|nr:hypothetical protein [Nitrososphaera sp.]